MKLNMLAIIAGLLLTIVNVDGMSMRQPYDCAYILEKIEYHKGTPPAKYLERLLEKNSCEPAVSRDSEVSIEAEAKEWYVRLTVEDPARGMKSQSAQLGQLTIADAVEKNSLKSLRPFGSSYLEIVFINPDGLPMNEYKSNFHVYRDNISDSWHFTVKSDDIYSDVIVSWRALYVLASYVDAQGRRRYNEYRSLTNPLLQKMQVVDESSGVKLPVSVNGKAPSFIVNMNGKSTKSFRWDLLTEAVKTSKVPEVPDKQNNVHTFLRAVGQPKKPLFDLSQPPVFVEPR